MCESSNNSTLRTDHVTIFGHRPRVSKAGATEEARTTVSTFSVGADRECTFILPSTCYFVATRNCNKTVIGKVGTTAVATGNPNPEALDLFSYFTGEFNLEPTKTVQPKQPSLC